MKENSLQQGGGDGFPGGAGVCVRTPHSLGKEG